MITQAMKIKEKIKEGFIEGIDLQITGARIWTPNNENGPVRVYVDLADDDARRRSAWTLYWNGSDRKWEWEYGPWCESRRKRHAVDEALAAWIVKTGVKNEIEN